MDRASIPNTILYPPVVNQANGETDPARPSSAESASDSGKMKVHARLFSVPREEENSSDSDRKEVASTDEESSLQGASKAEEVVIDEKWRTDSARLGSWSTAHVSWRLKDWKWHGVVTGFELDDSTWDSRRLEHLEQSKLLVSLRFSFCIDVKIVNKPI